MLKKILIGLAAVIAIFAIIVALQPPHFQIERSVTIAASPTTIFPHINDLRQAQVWSPWLKLDPAAIVAYEGPPAGTGASSTWSGNKNVGEGRQTIIESRPNERVTLRLDFKKPFAGTATAQFALKPAGTQTVVTWSMSGESNFIARAVCVFMNQDKMIGGQFEKGLADLKSLTEGEKTLNRTASATSAKSGT